MCSHSTWVLPAVKFMFYNILVNQRITKKFQKRLEKIVIYIWMLWISCLLLHPLC